jgi:hypothetical protein
MLHLKSINMQRNAENSANDYYIEFTGTEKYFHYSVNLFLTEGIKESSINEECFWFLDIIASYQFEQKFKDESFQVWKLERIENNSFKVTATDGNDNILAVQLIPFSDFFFQGFTVWKVDNVILLPSEY